MNYSLSGVALLALAGITTAQIPACATKCISDAVASSTPCGPTDVQCQCTNMPAIQQASTPCVLSACGDKALDVLAAAMAQCDAVKSAALSYPADATTAIATTSVKSTSTSVAALTSPASTAPSSYSSAASTYVSSPASINSTSAVIVPTTSANSTPSTPTEVPVSAGSQLNAVTGDQSHDETAPRGGFRRYSERTSGSFRDVQQNQSCYHPSQSIRSTTSRDENKRDASFEASAQWQSSQPTVNTRSPSTLDKRYNELRQNPRGRIVPESVSGQSQIIRHLPPATLVFALESTPPITDQEDPSTHLTSPHFLSREPSSLLEQVSTSPTRSICAFSSAESSLVEPGCKSAGSPTEVSKLCLISSGLEGVGSPIWAAVLGPGVWNVAFLFSRRASAAGSSLADRLQIACRGPTPILSCLARDGVVLRLLRGASGNRRRNIGAEEGRRRGGDSKLVPVEELLAAGPAGPHSYSIPRRRVGFRPAQCSSWKIGTIGTRNLASIDALDKRKRHIEHARSGPGRDRSMISATGPLQWEPCFKILKIPKILNIQFSQYT
ncbi:hypothetical protein JHW43_001450 [Diplocarpon mali]|nr:hypothetical protein JHW43_001450 [Diplocarpon mali]